MIRFEDRWIRCKGCGHKLMKLLRPSKGEVEIKCHSCKTINAIDFAKVMKEVMSDEGVGSSTARRR